MGPDRSPHRVAGRRGLRSWALLGGTTSLALGAWVAVALRMGPREDVGLVVLVGVILAVIVGGVVASTESWSSASDPVNRRPGAGPRGADPGGGGDIGGS